MSRPLLEDFMRTAIQIIISIVLFIVPLSAFADSATILGYPTSDVVVVNIGDRVYPVRLMGVAAPGSSVIKNFKLKKSPDQVIQFLAKTAPPGTKVNVEFEGKREDYVLPGYLAGYVWLPDGKMLNEEVIRAGHCLLLKEGKYVDRLQKAAAGQTPR